MKTAQAQNPAQPARSLYLQRQGVADSYRRSFAPCAHDHPWHISVDRHQAGIMVELNYPNCELCYAPVRPKEEDYPVRWDYVEAVREWSNCVRSGQVCESNRETYRALRDLITARVVAEGMIRKHVPGWENVRIEPEVEAYMYNGPDSVRIWPHVASDFFDTAVEYDEASSSIRLLDGTELVRFDDANEATVVCRGTLAELASITTDACVEFAKAHVQRNGPHESRCWLAWLISEHMRDQQVPFPREHRASMESATAGDAG